MKENATGRKLNALREEAGYSEEKLAKLLNCSPELIEKWESGEQEPDMNSWLIMCSLYSVSPDEMFSHINAENLVDSEVKEDFLHEASVNRMLRRFQYA